MKSISLMFPKQRGSMLVIAIFIVTVMFSLGLVMTNVLVDAGRSVTSEVYGLRALNAANSGIEVGLNTLFPLNQISSPNGCSDALFNPAVSNDSLDLSEVSGLTGCTVDVACTQFVVPNTGRTHFRLVSTALCRATEFTAQRTVALDARTFP